MRKTKLILSFFGILIILILIFFFLQKGSKTENQTSAKIILFYGIGCPHCKRVKEFIRENKVKEKISFDEKEVYFNRKNSKKLIEIAKGCGLKENEIGVPFLWDGESQKCIVGEEPIINFFKEKLNL